MSFLKKYYPEQNKDIIIDFNHQKMSEYLSQAISMQTRIKLSTALAKGSGNNRIYSQYGQQQAPGFISTCYTKPLIYAGQPYYCPNGWRRYGLYLGMSKQQFANKYDDWPVCYHGTSRKSAQLIIENGFKSSNNSACWIQKTDKAVFVTPSIVYAGHPRYAKIQKYQGKYIQIVLQLRIKESKIIRKAGTLQNTFSSIQKSVDINYQNNNELEWVFGWNSKAYIKAEDGIVVYGIMARITNLNPRFYKNNQWWEESRERLKWDNYQLYQ